MEHSQTLSLIKVRNTSVPGRNLLAEVDILRLVASQKLATDNKEANGQFLTPAPVARLMAGMFERFDLPEICLLDAGAGTGSLLAAFVSRLCQQPRRPGQVRIVAYETDSLLIEYLRQTLTICTAECKLAGITLHAEIRQADFIEDAVRRLQPVLFDQVDNQAFTHAILNPPYAKINAHSKTRALLQEIGLETTNLYAGFMALSALLLQIRGEMVSITPRSFCNGLYFRDFRRLFLETMSLRQVHLFDSRKEAFRDDAVLQETVIVHAVKQEHQGQQVCIHTSVSAHDDMVQSHDLPYTDVVHPSDPGQFIRLLPDSLSQQIVEQMKQFCCALSDLEVTVSTGRVVDFRAKDYLRAMPAKDTVPLIYPVNFAGGMIEHPILTKKPQALVYTDATKALLVPNEHYVLCKRFSSKEEKRRLVAVLYDADRMECSAVGFENHLNYFHQHGRGLDRRLARGLATYLNSSLVDAFFRLFNGHTQVNATDLRSLKYPTLQQMIAWGERVGTRSLSQQEIDDLIGEELLSGMNQPLTIKNRIDEALQVLTQLGLPRAQINERSALTLLALLNLKPDTPWHSASTPLMGITPMMDFMAQHYSKIYKPNTRETVRRQTIHQFLDAAFIVANPDSPKRPINSPKTVYQIEETALELLRTYGTEEWEKSIRTYVASVETLKQRYAQEREMARIPVLIEGELKTLSPGGQNVLIEQIINEFASRFTPGGKLIYVGDTDEKFAHFSEQDLGDLGIKIDSHGKMPDVIIHFTEKNWLVLIEAVTSHGPINAKRKKELEILFNGSTVPIVMVTTFLSRRAMIEYLADIAWETDVWVADDASHLIHFNGHHLLQLYQQEANE